MISAEWLTAKLRAGGFPPQFRVRGIRLIGRHEGESATLYTLRVRYGDVGMARKLPEDLVLKVYRPGLPHADREVSFYREFRPELERAYGGAASPLPSAFDAFYDTSADQSHVLLAGLPKRFKQHHEPQPPTKRHTTQLADALARIHACFWEDERLGESLGLAITESGLDEELARQRAGCEQFLSDGMIVLSGAQRKAVAAVAGRMPSLYRERLLSGQTLTLIHRNLRPANLLYSHEACRILDWKDWQPGFAAEDLAFMIAFHWPPAKRRFEEQRFLKRHWDELRRRGILNYSYQAALRDYRTAIGLRLSEMIGSWRRDDWRNGKWPLWKTIAVGLGAFEDLNAIELFHD